MTSLNGVALLADGRGHANYSSPSWKMAPPAGANTETGTGVPVISDFFIKIKEGYQFVITDMHNKSACLPGTEIYESPISKYCFDGQGGYPTPPQPSPPPSHSPPVSLPPPSPPSPSLPPPAPFDCKLDFLTAEPNGNLIHGTDDNLLLEVVAALRLVDHISETNSYDPYTCKVRKSFFYECLDIASPKTLSSSINGTYGVSASQTSFTWLSDGLNTSSIDYFGGAVRCHDKITGDGAVNSFDLAVLLWYQFEQPPYDRSKLSRSPAEVSTVEGRHDTFTRCETNETRTAWQLTVADDYCALAHNATVASGRRLGDTQKSEQSYTEMAVEVFEWAVMPGEGRWVRIHAATVLLSLELFLSGFAMEGGTILSNEKTPAFNCTDCVPLLASPNKPTLTFARFLEYEGVSAERAAADCAIILGMTPETALTRNVLALRQTPAFKACQFDTFLWIPQQPDSGVHVAASAEAGSFSAHRLEQLGATGDCGNDFGVKAGSTGMDGRAGQVQHTAACVQYGVEGLQLGAAPSPPPNAQCSTECRFAMGPEHGPKLTCLTLAESMMCSEIQKHFNLVAAPDEACDCTGCCDASFPSAPPLPLSPPPPPPPLAPQSVECANVSLVAHGWQMVSFNCMEGPGSSFDFLNAAPFKVDDKILSRDGRLYFAVYNGIQWVGNLLTQVPSAARGYKIFYSGAADAVLRQNGEPQLPLEDVVLSNGWNWIGHAPLISYAIDSGIATVGSDAFSHDDQIKTRSGANVRVTTYDGSTFQGGLVELKPGVGYEVKVTQAVTFRYTWVLR